MHTSGSSPSASSNEDTNFDNNLELESVSTLANSPGKVFCRRSSTNIPPWGITAIKQSSIESPWTVHISNLKQSSTLGEAMLCLRKIENNLHDIDKKDRIKHCKKPFEDTVKSLRKSLRIDSELTREVNYLLVNYFDESGMKTLPHCIIQEIMMWIPTDEFFPILSVSKEFYQLGINDIVWNVFYLYKFQRHNPNSMPSLTSNYIELYKQRLIDPEIGDRVEVAWQGKFRLEAQEVYQGRAWWVAEVVDKHTEQGRYKIRYPGWDSRWDEWVARGRLRWAVDKNTSARISTNDTVELWCFGSNVPGAWLEARIKKIRGNKYCVGKVLSTGSLWVDRDRLRPVKKINRDTTTSNSSTSGQNTNLMLHPTSQNIRRQLTSCSIM
eukprot:gene1530-2948_t